MVDVNEAENVRCQAVCTQTDRQTFYVTIDDSFVLSAAALTSIYIEGSERQPALPLSVTRLIVFALWRSHVPTWFDERT